MEDRIEIAKGFKARSDLFIRSAERVFIEQQDHHASINRSWYSVMQLITAATWLVLTNKKPPANQLNWNHKLQATLFEEVASRKTGIPKEVFSKYSREIELLYEKREEADYRVDKEAYVNESSARYCLASAQRIRKKVNELVGEWPC